MSISTALSIVLNASNDEKEIKDALEINNLKREDILFLNKKYLDYLSSIKPEDSVFINLENNLFVEKSQIIDDNVKIRLNNFFNCKSNVFDSSSASINKVNDLISNPENHINSADKLVLINNFSFNAKFLNMSTIVNEFEFKEEGEAYMGLITIEEIIIKGNLGIAYFSDLKFESIQLEYKKGLIMTIILPLKGVSIEDIQLNSDIFEKILNQMKTNNKEYISLKIPKFKIQSEYEVTLLIQ